MSELLHLGLVVFLYPLVVLEFPEQFKGESSAGSPGSGIRV
jgi:hypothetical protein